MVGQPRYFVGIDQIRFSGKVLDQRALILYFNRLLPSYNEWYSFCGQSPNGLRQFFLQRSSEDYISHARRHHKEYRYAINVATLISGNDTQALDLVAKLRLGATRATCADHGYVRGPHKRGGNFGIPCLAEQMGKKCPSDHYKYVPRRCGRCTYSDEFFWQCHECRSLTHGIGCPECDRRTARKPHLFIEIKGAGCRLGLLEPLVQYLFAQFAIMATIVREGIHIALDLELPYAAILPFQKMQQEHRKGRPFSVVEAMKFGSETPCMFCFGRDRRVVTYCKRSEYRHRREEAHDLTASLPEHMLPWDNDSGTRLEFRSKNKTSPWMTHRLCSVQKDWLTFAIADLRLAKPTSIEADLLAEAKMFGFVHHKPSIERVRQKLGRIETPPLKRRRYPGRDHDVIDIWTYRKERARDAESNVSVMSRALYVELVRIQHPFNVGQAVEKALPALEQQIQRALTPPPRELASWVGQGQRLTEAPGVVTWELNNAPQRQVPTRTKPAQ